MRFRKMTICGALLLLFVSSVAGQDDKKDKQEKQDKKIEAQLMPVPDINLLRAQGLFDGGRFRVSLTGFTVNRQTNDNILESDGKGDEVYILADSAQYDSYSDTALGGVSPLYARVNRSETLRGRGNLTQRRSLASVVMGDINRQEDPPRIQAGSASHLGGLRTGDRFPTNEPWNLTGAPRRESLPMLLWEGELQRSRDLVVLIPTIWEWDGGNAEMRSAYTTKVSRYFPDASQSVRWKYAVGQDLLGAGDRPIGLLSDENDWAPTALFLTFDTAQRAVTTSPSSIGTGVVEIRYAAYPEDYSLYLKIERLR